MAAPIQFLHQLCKRTFQTLKSSETINLGEIRNSLNKISAKDVGFDPVAYKELELKMGRAPVSYIELYQDENSHTMAIFVIKTGASLPLHDHPGMCGLLKVIYGNIKLTSYSEIEPHPIPQRCLVKPHGGLVKTVIKNPDIIASETSDCFSLTPKTDNFHEIQPLTEFAAFLDILVPPYNHMGCHYFQELQDPVSHSTEDHKWLLEIPEPKQYYCDVLPYAGPELVHSD